jgi:hypothetical protein
MRVLGGSKLAGSGLKWFVWSILFDWPTNSRDSPI